MREGRRLEEERAADRAANTAYEHARATASRPTARGRMSAGMVKPFERPEVPTGLMRTDCAEGRGRAWTDGMYSFMRRVLATWPGQELDRQRQIKFNRAINRFQCRGRSACHSEWRLIAATHNLLELHNHGLTAATP